MTIVKCPMSPGFHSPVTVHRHCHWSPVTGHRSPVTGHCPLSSVLCPLSTVHCPLSSLQRPPSSFHRHRPPSIPMWRALMCCRPACHFRRCPVVHLQRRPATRLIYAVSTRWATRQYHPSSPYSLSPFAGSPQYWVQKRGRRDRRKKKDGPDGRV